MHFLSLFFYFVSSFVYAVEIRRVNGCGSQASDVNITATSCLVWTTEATSEKPFHNASVDFFRGTDDGVEIIRIVRGERDVDNV